jgi:hypothetical protein
MLRVPPRRASRRALPRYCLSRAPASQQQPGAAPQLGHSSSKPVVVSNSKSKFEKDVLNDSSDLATLYRDISCTLTAIDAAVAGEPLEGGERLGVFQNLLVDLVSYLERDQDFPHRPW